MSTSQDRCLQALAMSFSIIPLENSVAAIHATDISSVPARCALGRDPGTMILVTPISLAMTRFLATVEKTQAKIVPGPGTLWNLPGTTTFVILIYIWFLTVPSGRNSLASAQTKAFQKLVSLPVRKNKQERMQCLYINECGQAGCWG